MPKTKKRNEKAIVNHIIFSSFIHETEIKDKIVSGILDFIPENKREDYKDDFHLTSLQGVFGNKITLVSLKIADKAVSKIFRYLYSRIIPLNFQDFSLIFDEEKQFLHLRIHKLQLFNDSPIPLSQGQDVLKVMIKFQCYPKCTKESVYSYLEKENKDE